MPSESAAGANAVRRLLIFSPLRLAGVAGGAAAAPPFCSGARQDLLDEQRLPVAHTLHAVLRMVLQSYVERVRVHVDDGKRLVADLHLVAHI